MLLSYYENYFRSLTGSSEMFLVTVTSIWTATKKQAIKVLKLRHLVLKLFAVQVREQLLSIVFQKTYAVA